MLVSSSFIVKFHLDETHFFSLHKFLAMSSFFSLWHSFNVHEISMKLVPEVALAKNWELLLKLVGDLDFVDFAKVMLWE